MASRAKRKALARPEQEYQRGYKDGFKAAAKPMVRHLYAAAALAAHDLYGFGALRSARLLNRLDYHALNTLTSQELIDEVWDKFKLKIRFDEAFDRVEVKE